MAKAILTTKVDPTYDDLPEQRYHFPCTYLRPLKVGRLVAFAVPAVSSRAGVQVVRKGKLFPAFQ
ncbi:hypothetical protein EPK84_16505 [Sinorhizobium fredii]|nr:hypothetical protein EPK84_16505 [Sinorhizobium fredii]